MKRTTFYFLTLMFIVWIQLASQYFLGASGFSTNVILCSVLYFGLSRGPLSGEMLGFLSGLLIDASSLGLLGLHALLYAGAGFVAGILRRQLDEDKVWTQAIFTLGISILYVIFYFVLDRLFSSGPHPISWSMAAQPLLNAIVAPLIFGLLRIWSDAWAISRVEG